MKKIYFILINILFVISVIQASQSFNPDTLSEKSDNRIQTLPKGISIYELDNGMQVLLIENPALPMVGVNVAVKVGSAYETFSTSGMSHMLEHLLFNGTTTRNQKQLYDDVDMIGGYNNAHTDLYYTDYMMVTPAENIIKGMEIQADMLFNSIMPQEKFEKEKGIVLEEISKSLADPQEQLERNTISILYNGHALSLPTLGTYSTIKSFSRDDVNSFYKNYYVPNNMMLTVIGNFQTKDILQSVKDIYGKSGPGNVKRDLTPGWNTGFQIPDASLLQKDFTYNRFYDGKNIVLQLFYEIPQYSSAKFSELLDVVLSRNQDTIQSSLQSEFPSIVKSVNLSSRLSPVKNFVGVVVMLAKEDSLDLLVNSVSKKLGALSFGLSDENITSEAAIAQTDFLKNIEKPHMFGIYNSDALVNRGIEAVLASYYPEEYYKAAEELKTLKIQSKPLVIIQSPSAKDENVTVSTSADIKQFKDNPSGAEVIAVQNDLSKLIAVHYLIKHKAYYESKYGKDAAKILHNCIEQRMQSDENQKMSNKYGLTYVFNDNPFIPMDDIYLNPDFGYIRVEGLADDLTGIIGYLNSQFLNFIPTEEEFNKAEEQFQGMGMMGMGGDKSKKMFDETYKSLVYETDPGAKKPELTYDNLTAFSKEYFQPANMIISVVSPASPESINNLFNNFTGNPATDEPPVYSRSFRLIDKDTTIEKDLQGQRSYLFWGFTVPIDPKDAPALQALSLLLADNIIFDIREKQGMAYNMNAGIDINNDKALFYISQGTRPENVDKLVPQ
ncbi:MAG TPA: insulinase family protein, partial [Ignavibacteriaceae bacterium]|nr:insulinase family protein [Ignavibacteriaceae bacterium]